MADTFSQILIQTVFAVQGRQNLIRHEHKEELHKYITGIISQQGQKLLAIHCAGCNANRVRSNSPGHYAPPGLARSRLARFCFQSSIAVQLLFPEPL